VSGGGAGLLIRPAGIEDVPLVLRFIRGIADYERLAKEMVATEEMVRDTLFGPRPAADCLIAFLAETPAGFAIFFSNYSTFLGRTGVYLEDLYVEPALRGQGVGRALLARVARIAADRGAGRLEWSVLDWNEPAIRFYESLGARAMTEWTVWRLAGDALRKVASEDSD
jgi:GNAT superfamily N-acetyltransferase